jgi:hypothetical protein
MGRADAALYEAKRDRRAAPTVASGAVAEL